MPEDISQIPLCAESHLIPEYSLFKSYPPYMSRCIRAQRLCSRSAQKSPDGEISYENSKHNEQNYDRPYPQRNVCCPVRHDKIRAHHTVL